MNIFAETKKPTKADRLEQLNEAKRNLEKQQASLFAAKVRGDAKSVKFLENMVSSIEKMIEDITELYNNA